jgi:hypothetical protein
MVGDGAFSLATVSHWFFSSLFKWKGGPGHGMRDDGDLNVWYSLAVVIGSLRAFISWLRPGSVLAISLRRFVIGVASG